MKPAPVDIAYLYDAFCEYAEPVTAAWEASGADTDEDPQRLIDAMSQLAGVLRSLENDPRALSESSSQDIHTLGEYGLRLLSDLSGIAEQLGVEHSARGLENLCLPLAVWTARHGGDIRLLEPVVSALAYFANNSQEPEFMAELLGLTNEIFDAVAPSASEDARHARHPWRLLILNRAIVATRTLQPALMEPTYDSVVELLPEEANRFFSEGMEQIESLELPMNVREMISRYYQAFGAPRILH